jgi:hypothetical protein
MTPIEESIKSQAEAWGAVFDALCESCPEWLDGKECGMDKAVKAVRRLALIPELVQALTAALPVLSGEHDTDSARQEAESIVRTAIAKAEGR